MATTPNPTTPTPSATPTKRVLVDKANTVIVTVTAVAAFVIIFSLVASKTLLSQAMYQNRVAGAKKDTLALLKKDITASNDLVASYKAFNSADPNIIGGSSTGDGANDGSNARIVLDALPSSYDFPALVTSLEKIITARGLTIQSIQGSDDEVAQQGNQSSATPEPIAMPFQVTITGNYTAMQDLIDDFQNSIRPFQIQTESLSGDENSMTMTLNAQTFYQPEKDLNIGNKVVK
jgi:hypothetical protein